MLTQIKPLNIDITRHKIVPVEIHVIDQQIMNEEATSFKNSFNWNMWGQIDTSWKTVRSVPRTGAWGENISIFVSSLSTAGQRGIS